MSPPGEMYSAPPMSDEILSQQSMVLAIRQVGDAMRAITLSQQTMTAGMEKLVGKVDDVRDRVTRLEERNTQVERLEREVAEHRLEATTERSALRLDLKAACDRIVLLEAERQRQDGAKGVWKLLAEKAPWLLPIAGMIAGALGMKAMTPAH